MIHDSQASPREVREELVDLICGDSDLLRAEFEAIVQAGWPDRPLSPPDGPGAGHERPARYRLAESGDDPAPEGPDVASAGSRSRQRSPPITWRPADPGPPSPGQPSEEGR